MPIQRAKKLFVQASHRGRRRVLCLLAASISPPSVHAPSPTLLSSHSPGSVVAAFTMSALSRAFLRTSRAALRQRSGANPLSQTLGLNGTQQYLSQVRNYAAAFERNKPHVNIGKASLLRCIGLLNSDAYFRQVPLVTSITAR